MKSLFSISILFILTFINCKQDDKQALLIGKWQGVSWKVKGVESGRNFKGVHFEFKNDNTYSASFDSQSETGTFRLSGDKLYTTGENKIEKMVKLTGLTADTMIMDMNRVGDQEELVLAKIN